MSITARTRRSRAGIERAEPIGFRMSGFRTRFRTLENPDHSNMPPVWSTQTLGIHDIEVEAGALEVIELGTVVGPCADARVELWGAQYFDNGAFTDVTNDIGTQFYNVGFKLFTDSGLIYSTRHLISVKPKHFHVYLLGGEPLRLYVHNDQAVAVRFSIEFNLDIEPLHRIEEKVGYHHYREKNNV